MSRQIKAVLGIAAMAVLFFVVLGYLNQYRHAADLVSQSTSKPKGYESTATTTTATSKTDAKKTSSSTTKASAKDSTAPKKGDKIVVVQIQGLNFRESPDKNANVIRGLDENEELVWVETADGWYKVRDAGGVEGYITSNDQYAKLGTKK